MILTVTLNTAIDKRYVVEDFAPGAVTRVKECNHTAGGKGLNVSRVASLLGENVVATGFVGGYAGDFIVEELEKSSIQSNFVKVRGESRSCVNLYNEKTGQQTEFLEPGVTVTEADIASFQAKFEELVRQCAVVTLSGSAPRGVPADIYQTLIAMAHKENKPVLLDTSGELLVKGIEAKPTLIKPNTDEIQMLTKGEALCEQDLIRLAKGLHQSGIPYVVVSRGKNGVLAVTEEGVFKGETPDIPVINTVGCGDSMIAAFAVGMERGYSSEEMLRLALAVSTANALHTRTGYIEKNDVDTLLRQVTVIPINEKGDSI